MTSLLKRLATNAINWDTGQHSTLGTQKPQSQVTSLPSRWFNRTEVGTLQPARLSQITIMGLEPRVQLDGAGRFKNFLVDTGDTYSVLISYSGGFSSQTCTVLGATGKTTTKRFTRALLCCWDGQIFSHQLLVVPECPTSLLGRDILTKLGITLVIRSFSAPKALQLLVTIEERITPSPIERTKNYGRTKLTTRCGSRGLLDEPTKLNWSSLSSKIPLGFLTGNNIPSKERHGRDNRL